MTNGLQWLPGAYPEGFSVAFRRGSSETELLRSLSISPEDTLNLTRRQAELLELHSRYPNEYDLELEGLDEEALQESGHLKPSCEVVRIGQIPDWTFAIQSFGSYATKDDIAVAASVNSCYISFSLTVNASCHVQAAIDGTITDSFDPNIPNEGTVQIFPAEEIAATADPSQAALAYLEQQYSLWIPLTAETDSYSAAVFR